MIVRVGVSRSLRRLRGVCESIKAPMMLSAGSLIDYRHGGLKVPNCLIGADVALDSAGFVAMKVHGGTYPWSCAQYLDVVEKLKPTWYASRDYCVEPELIDSPLERARRIERTVSEYLKLCGLAENRGLSMPIPVLQGWYAEEYLKCAELMGIRKGLVGVGSVCRRNLRGKDGLGSILDALTNLGLRLHLFGVKGAALKSIRSDMFWSKCVVSTDSHAWDFSARKKGIRTLDGRITHLKQWYSKITNYKMEGECF